MAVTLMPCTATLIEQAAAGCGEAVHAVNADLQPLRQPAHGRELIEQMLGAVGRQAPAIAVVVGGNGNVSEHYGLKAGQQMRGEVVDLHIDGQQWNDKLGLRLWPDGLAAHEQQICEAAQDLQNSKRMGPPTNCS